MAKKAEIETRESAGSAITVVVTISRGALDKIPQ